MPRMDSKPSGNLNVLSEDPLCAGVFLPDLDAPISPVGSHFIRSHFAAPQIDPSDWSLMVTGDVENPLDFRYDELHKMPSHEIVSLMECAGNSRSTMQPPAEGVQWDNGGVGVSRWKGILVRTLLEQATLKSVATDVLFEGADSGTEPHGDGPM